MRFAARCSLVVFLLAASAACAPRLGRSATVAQLGAAEHRPFDVRYEFQGQGIVAHFPVAPLEGSPRAFGEGRGTVYVVSAEHEGLRYHLSLAELSSEDRLSDAEFIRTVPQRFPKAQLLQPISTGQNDGVQYDLESTPGRMSRFQWFLHGRYVVGLQVEPTEKGSFDPERSARFFAGFALEPRWQVRLDPAVDAAYEAPSAAFRHESRTEEPPAAYVTQFVGGRVDLAYIVARVRLDPPLTHEVSGFDCSFQSPNSHRRSRVLVQARRAFVTAVSASNRESLDSPDAQRFFASLSWRDDLEVGATTTPPAYLPLARACLDHPPVCIETLLAAATRPTSHRGRP
jgi:hypothetical protein